MIPSDSEEAGLDVRGLDCGILSAVSFRVSAGEVVCLSGSSGTGKTRLLRALVDLDPNRGEVTLDGEHRESMPAHRWRRRVGYLPTETHWWADTVGEHFAEPDERVLLALGFDRDTLDWDVRRLSSGERARLGLARLWSLRPRALLLDEPTASLDTESSARVEHFLSSVAAAGRPLLWVSHDAQQIRRVAHRHLVIREGRLWSS